MSPNDTQERREDGQRVDLTPAAWHRNLAQHIIAALLVAAIVSLVNVWARSEANAKDVKRLSSEQTAHTTRLNAIESSMAEVRTDVQWIRRYFEDRPDVKNARSK